MMKTGLNKKAKRLIVASIGFMAVCLFTSGFLSVWDMRFHTIGENQKENAQVFADFIADQVEKEVSDVQAYLSSPWWHQAINAELMSYDPDPEAVRERMLRLDEQWIAAGEDDPLVRERLDSGMGLRLKALVEHDTAIAEILLTDKNGGLVAASGKTSDFFQADEVWWRRAYNNGKGGIFFGGIEEHPSIGKTSMPIAVPVKDGTGEVIGVSKALLDIAEFVKPLAGYKFGKTGHVALLDAQGNVVYHQDDKPMAPSGMTAAVLRRLLNEDHGFSIITGCTGKKALASGVKIKSPYFEANGIDWVIVVTQEQHEVFLPFYRIFGMELLLIMIVAYMIMFVLRNFIRRIFIDPLQRISEGVRHFADGDLGQLIDVKTADEFELLAGSLNTMAEHLKQTMISRDSLVKEVERRRQAEQDLRASEKRSMDIFYASKDAMFLINGDKIVDCNEAAVRILGFGSSQELLMAHPSDFSPPLQPDGKSSLEKANELMLLAFKEGFQRFKWLHRRANGENFLAQVSLSPMIIQGVELLHCVVIDITRQEEDERRLRSVQAALKEKSVQLESALEDSRRSREILTSMLEDNNQNRDELELHLKELKRSQNMLINSEKLASLGRLVSEIAHEVNNPLMIISGNAQLALMGGALSDEDKQSFETIMKECQRAKEVIRRVLRFAKPSKGEIKQVDLGQSIEGVVGIVEKQFGLSHNVQIERHYLENQIQVSFDEQQLQEVFMNLLNNAKEAMTQGGVISITTGIEGDLVKVDFKDNGPGMSEETMKKIMEPFFTTKETGTGIGLAICYGIVKAHNGDLRFESELGKGTTATIFLPRVPGGKV